MQQFYDVLQKHILFNGFSHAEFEELLVSLSARLKQFYVHEVVRKPETRVTEIGIVVRGRCHVSKTDYNGNRVMLAEVGVGKTFGESLVFTDDENCPYIVIAAESTSVVFLPFQKIMEFCNHAYPHHTRLLLNIINLLVQETLNMQLKNDILSQKTTREKLLLYFEYESRTRGNKMFNISFSRDELADFLCLNSSAMSRELGKMRDEGILTFHKNKFELMQ